MATDADVEALKRSIKGQVITKLGSTDEEYRAAVRRWNEVFEKEAAVVVYVHDADDVAQCIKFVTQQGIDLAVAGGRHALKGTSSSDGLVIDLRRMRKVTVDKALKIVIAQGGCLGEDVDDAAWEEGLSVVSGTISQTGIGGLTQGGGIGHLSGQYGLMIDNLLEATVVLANGDIVKTSKDNHPDLFWAIRGCGANFGVITEFIYRAHDQGQVLFGFLIYEPDKLERFLDCCDALGTDLVPHEKGKLAAMVFYSSPPPTGKPAPTFFIFWDGPEAEGREKLKVLFDLGPIADTLAVHPYPQVNKVFNEQLNNTFTRHGISAAKLSIPLNREIMRKLWHGYSTVIPQYPSALPSHILVQLEYLPKILEVRNDEMAYCTRGPWNHMLLHPIWESPEDDHVLRKWSTDLSKAAKAINREHGLVDQSVESYSNYASGDEAAEQMFGTNYPRLQRLKAIYDPTVLFNKWYPIKPMFE